MLRYEHSIYNADFESKKMFSEAINRKLDILESNLNVLKKNYLRIEELNNNSNQIENAQVELANLISTYNRAIEEIKSLKNNLRG